MIRRSLYAVSCFLCIAIACDRPVATQVLVRVDAGPITRARADAFRVTVLDTEGAVAEERRIPLGGASGLALPYEWIPLVPRDGEADRRYRVDVTLEAGGVDLRTMGIEGAYVEGERVERTILFEDVGADAGPDADPLVDAGPTVRVPPNVHAVGPYDGTPGATYIEIPRGFDVVPPSSDDVVLLLLTAQVRGTGEFDRAADYSEVRWVIDGEERSYVNGNKEAGGTPWAAFTLVSGAGPIHVGIEVAANRRLRVSNARVVELVIPTPESVVSSGTLGDTTIVGSVDAESIDLTFDGVSDYLVLASSATTEVRITPPSASGSDISMEVQDARGTVWPEAAHHQGREPIRSFSAINVLSGADGERTAVTLNASAGGTATIRHPQLIAFRLPSDMMVAFDYDTSGRTSRSTSNVLLAQQNVPAGDTALVWQSAFVRTTGREDPIGEVRFVRGVEMETFSCRYRAGNGTFPFSAVDVLSPTSTPLEMYLEMPNDPTETFSVRDTMSLILMY